MTLGFTQTINGQPNFFIEKIWAGLIATRQATISDYERYQDDHRLLIGSGFPDYGQMMINSKDHTIREDRHNRWKACMDIHFVINNRSPKRFQFAPVVKCVLVQEIKIDYYLGPDIDPQIFIAGKIFYSERIGVDFGLRDLAVNDGFDGISSFLDYFDRNFTGKIIHWTNLKY